MDKKNGSHTPEQCARQGASIRKVWREQRPKKLKELNANRRASSVRELRLFLKMSQQEFAKAIGFSHSNQKQISRYECGAKAPPPDKIERMRVLAVSHGLPDWTYTG